jgi:hypothetical protein
VTCVLGQRGTSVSVPVASDSNLNSTPAPGMSWFKSKSSVGSTQLQRHSVAGQESPEPPHPVGDFHSVSPDFPGVAGQPFDPHCGKPEQTDDGPYRGASSPETGASSRGKPDLERANSTLNTLPLTWARTAYGERASAKELAIAFRRALQVQPELVGIRVHEHWIRQNYPLFCASLRVDWPPPYNDFLHELEKEMPRKRLDLRPKGMPRQTFMTYRVPDPNETAVVVLSDEMRKRANSA